MIRRLFLATASFALASCLALTACGGSSSSGSSNADTPADESQQEEQAEAVQTLGLGSSFEFDGFTIQIGDSISTTTLENQYSEKDGSTIIVLPITLTNNGEEANNLNMFYVTEYGSQGLELDSVYTYFDDIRMAGKMQPGATMSGALYFLYDGDGSYILEFATLASEPIEVELQVQLG